MTPPVRMPPVAGNVFVVVLSCADVAMVYVQIWAACCVTTIFKLPFIVIVALRDGPVAGVPTPTGLTLKVKLGLLPLSVLAAPNFTQDGSLLVALHEHGDVLNIAVPAPPAVPKLALPGDTASELQGAVPCMMVNVAATALFASKTLNDPGRGAPVLFAEAV